MVYLSTVRRVKFSELTEEFKGRHMRNLIETIKINIIHGRPYHPLSQGNCKRSNRLFRQNNNFRGTNRNGFNWAESPTIIEYESNTSLKRILKSITAAEFTTDVPIYGQDENICKSDVRRLKQKHKLASFNDMNTFCQPKKRKR